MPYWPRSAASITPLTSKRHAVVQPHRRHLLTLTLNLNAPLALVVVMACDNNKILKKWKHFNFLINIIIHEEFFHFPDPGQQSMRLGPTPTTYSQQFSRHSLHKPPPEREPRTSTWGRVPLIRDERSQSNWLASLSWLVLDLASVDGSGGCHRQLKVSKRNIWHLPLLLIVHFPAKFVWEHFGWVTTCLDPLRDA